MRIFRSAVRAGGAFASVLGLAAVGVAGVGLLGTATLPAAAQGLALDPVEAVGALTRPVAIAAPGDGSGRLFVAQQTGEIVILDGGSLGATPFLDLSSRVTCCGERGLLGLAFHPDYASNGELFVDFTETVDAQLRTVVARYTVSAGDPDVADPMSEEILLTIDQPAGNHNGGQLAFGPDGFLYVGTGDGGGGGDPNENGQDTGALLGKVLRIDVDGADPGLAYAVPPDNPFVGVTGARDEIWAFGLRNPWRFSFDRDAGDLWIADVGQTAWEEIDLQPAGDPGGENYGWDCREGAHSYDDLNGDHNTTCPSSGFVDPILEYGHSSGRCSITGGYRYRGDAEPRLRGVYLYADYCTGEVFGTIPRCPGSTPQWQSRVLFDAPYNVTAFGEDAAGEIYLTQFAGGDPPPATSKLHLVALAAGSGGPDLVPAPDPIGFGTVEVGDTVSAQLTLTNDNAGPEAAAVTSTVLSDGGRFAIDAHGGAAPCHSLRPCLPPGASCTVVIELQASSAGAVSESLAYDGNFSGEIVQLTADVVPCSGDGVDVTLDPGTIDGAETHRACDTLTAGSGVVVGATGDLTLRAGTRIVLGDGFRLESGGKLVAEIF